MATCFGLSDHHQASIYHMKLHSMCAYIMGSHTVDSIFFIFLYLFTAIGLLPGGSGYFTCKQNMKLVTTRFKSGGLHEKHVVTTWNLGKHLSICL